MKLKGQILKIRDSEQCLNDKILKKQILQQDTLENQKNTRFKVKWAQLTQDVARELIGIDTEILKRTTFVNNWTSFFWSSGFTIDVSFV